MQKHLPQHPKRIETVHVEMLDGELCIYDWQRLKVHITSTPAQPGCGSYATAGPRRKRWRPSCMAT